MGEACSSVHNSFISQLQANARSTSRRPSTTQTPKTLRTLLLETNWTISFTFGLLRLEM